MNELEIKNDNIPKDLYISLYNYIYKYIYKKEVFEMEARGVLHYKGGIMKERIIHYPTLKTVLMVEDVLKNANQLITREDLKKKLKTKIMHQTLNLILKYLEDSGKILDGRKGIIWIYNPSPKLDKAIKEGIEL